MELDVNALKRALFDLFKFNPKDFYVQGSPTGYLVGLNGRSGGSSSGGGSIGSCQLVAHSIDTGTPNTTNGTQFVSSAQTTAAAALVLSDAQKANVDTSVTTAYNTVFASSVFAPGSIYTNANYPIILPISYKKTSLNRFFVSGAVRYSAALEERRFENFMAFQALLPNVNISIAGGVYRRTTIDNGTPTETLVTALSYITPNTTNVGAVFNLATSYPDIVAESWPTNPTAPTFPTTISCMIELVYKITFLAPT